MRLQTAFDIIYKLSDNRNFNNFEIKFDIETKWGLSVFVTYGFVRKEDLEFLNKQLAKVETKTGFNYWVENNGEIEVVEK